MTPIPDEQAIKLRKNISMRETKLCDRFLQKEMNDSLLNVFKKREGELTIIRKQLKEKKA